MADSSSSFVKSETGKVKMVNLIRASPLIGSDLHVLPYGERERLKMKNEIWNAALPMNHCPLSIIHYSSTNRRVSFSGT